MTLQIPDILRFRDQEYAVTAVDGSGLFDPQARGLQTGMLSTGCWRGYICTYEITASRLLLREVELGRSNANDEPLLFGVAPTEAGGRPAIHRHALVYTGLATPIEFTGRLLVGRDRIHLGYLNMGFPPAWLCEVVYDLVFDQGRLVAVHNRSAAMAEIRDRLGTDGLRRRDGQTMEDWISAAFSLSYEYSWPSVGGGSVRER
jgi:hypothetical protein